MGALDITRTGIGDGEVVVDPAKPPGLVLRSAPHLVLERGNGAVVAPVLVDVHEAREMLEHLRPGAAGDDRAGPRLGRQPVDDRPRLADQARLGEHDPTAEAEGRRGEHHVVGHRLDDALQHRVAGAQEEVGAPRRLDRAHREVVVPRERGVQHRLLEMAALGEQDRGAPVTLRARSLPFLDQHRDCRRDHRVRPEPADPLAIGEDEGRQFLEEPKGRRRDRHAEEIGGDLEREVLEVGRRREGGDLGLAQGRDDLLEDEVAQDRVRPVEQHPPVGRPRRPLRRQRRELGERRPARQGLDHRLELFGAKAGAEDLLHFPPPEGEIAVAELGKQSAHAQPRQAQERVTTSGKGEPDTRGEVLDQPLQRFALRPEALDFVDEDVDRRLGGRRPQLLDRLPRVVDA